MRRAIRIVCALGIIIGLVAGLMACTSAPASTPLSSDTVKTIRAYADPATETTMQGLSENNLEKYVQNSNAQFKAAVTREVFDKTAAGINSQFGSFVSIEYLRAEEQDGYIIVHYKAKFSRGEVGVRMVFGQDHLVAGQWFE